MNEFVVVGTEFDQIDPLVLRQLEAYVKVGQVPGGFVYAVLTNDLAAAVARADRHSQRTLRYIVAFVTNRLPSACWQNPDAVQRWMAHRGLSGLETRHPVGCMCPTCGEQSLLPRGKPLYEVFANEQDREVKS